MRVETKKDQSMSKSIASLIEEYLQSTNEEEKKVVAMDEQHIQILGVEYVILENYRNGFDIEALNKRYTDILNKYDFIVGDWGHEQLRLKGFYHDQNKAESIEKKIQSLEDYLYEYCNFGCAYFVLKKEGEHLEVKEPPVKHSPRRQKRVKQSEPKADTLIAPKKKPKSQQQTKKKKERSQKATGAPRHFEMREKVESNGKVSESTAAPKSKKRHFSIRQTEK